MSLERRHHSYSPSTLQMREACPLWAPTGESNEKAELGTKQHKFTEDRLDDGSLTDEQVLAAQECLEYADRIRRRFVDALWKKDPEGEKHAIEELSEAYLPLDTRNWTLPVFNPKTYKTDFVKEDSTTGGYVDLLLLIPHFHHIEMFDWKFGIWPVTDAKDNLQGLAYVLGAFREYPWAKTIRLHFKQPHIEAISSHTFRRRDYDKHLLKVKTVVERSVACAAEEDYSEANVMVPCCLFCGRRGKCKALHALVIEVGDKFWRAGMPENMNPAALDDPQRVSDGLRVAQIVESWASGYRRQKTLQVLEGTAPVPEGYRIMKYERREVKNPFRLFRLMRTYLTREQLARALRRKPSITAIERAYSDQFPRGTKSAQLAVLRQEMEDTGAVCKSQPTPYLGAIPKRKNSEDRVAPGDSTNDANDGGSE